MKNNESDKKRMYKKSIDHPRTNNISNKDLIKKLLQNDNLKLKST